MYNLRGYQITAVESIVKGFKELFYSGNPKTQIIFKSPTGSGKTLMMAAALESVITENIDSEIVYIWAAMGELHKQSYDKLKNQYLSDSDFNMITLDQMGPDALQKNTILFCNWESMFKTKRKENDAGIEMVDWDNTFVRIGENGRNLQEVLEKTRRDNRKIILIVDEAHRTYMGPNSQKLVDEVIQPDMTIEVSATPLLTLPDRYYEKNLGRYIDVELSDVIESGLIKNKTIINNDISGEITTSSTDEIVVDAAIRQRETLEQKYINTGSDIKPLILIQLPDSNSDENPDENMRTLVEGYLAKRGINYKNQKLAIWLSDDKTNKPLIDMPDSPVQVLIFKQAIATGWDCPRAQILVMLRDIKSITFEIQTVGRILRMPELKHYEDDDLNSAYLFTNIKDINPNSSTDAQVYFRTYKSKLPAGFKNIPLPDNSYSIRRDRKRLTKEFRPILINKLDNFFDIKFGDNNKLRHEKLDAKLQINPGELTVPILSNVVLDSLDNIDKSLWEKNVAHIKADPFYIGRAFNTLLRAWVSPYAAADSITVLRSTLYKWFEENGFTDKLEIQRILTCSNPDKPDNSLSQLTPVIIAAKQEFGRTEGESKDFLTNTFQIPPEVEFGQGFVQKESKKHALQPYYQAKNVSDPEIAFEQLLEVSADVKSWFRNGVSESKYFSVKYELENPINKQTESHGFYPDYIVLFNDGRIGIFDTKSGTHATSKETEAKLTALKSYINAHSKLNVFGGIIDVRGNKGAIKTFWLQTEVSGTWTSFAI